MVSKSSLQKAVEHKIIQPEQVDPLYDFLNDHSGPHFDFTHVLYYFGGLVAIGALTLFMNLGWEQFGGWGIVTICCAYATLGLVLTTTFERSKRDIPAGICAAFVVVLVPLGIYGFQQAMGYWPESSNYQDYHRYIKLLWLYMELGTLAAGAVMLWKYRYPFLIMPVAATLWYMSMDIAELFLGSDFSWRERSVVTMWFGLGMTVLAFVVDLRSRKTMDYAFWLYLFGILAFWGGLTSQHSGSELSKFLYFCINLLMIGSGVVLSRKVFVVLGALGSCFYLGYLANEVFKDSWMFPITLTAAGFGIIWLGVFWQKNEEAITTSFRRRLPVALQELLEQRLD